jgi:thiamine phosphate synthase YjbQ (UPF0047 family)
VANNDFELINIRVTSWLIKGDIMVFGEQFEIKTKGYSDIHNITGFVRDIIERSEIVNGLVNVFAVGSRHSETWGDDNGFSHIRATFMGPGLTAPVYDGSVVLGQWQQIVVIDHDNRPRSRKVFVQVMGE